ncbi:MAG: hypothetical protein IJZ03_04125 [Clostridia bacterium]|nr:hypothetical protein [Clostridia bacterium]
MEHIKVYGLDGNSCVRAYDFLSDADSDSDAIEKAIEYAREKNIASVLIDKKDYMLDRAILFYSDMTITVDGVTLKLKDGVFDNVFRSAGLVVDPAEPFGYPTDIKLTENVRIIGKNGARIEGPDKQSSLNYCTGEVEETLGDIWGWRTFMVLITRCEDFELGGFFITKTRNWAVSVERSKNGSIHDIEFYTSCVNGDGINLRNGCRNISIKNISGTTTDDLIALNNGSVFQKYPVVAWKTYLYPLVPSNFMMPSEDPGDGDISDIRIENVCLKPVRFVQAVALLARNGNKIRNIKIRGVYEQDNLESPVHANLIGAYYQENYGTLNSEVSMFDIDINTVVSCKFEYPVLFREHVSGLKVRNVTQKAESGVVVMAHDDDEIEIESCCAVSGRIRDSLENWKRPY